MFPLCMALLLRIVSLRTTPPPLLVVPANIEQSCATVGQFGENWATPGRIRPHASEVRKSRRVRPNGVESGRCWSNSDPDVPKSAQHCQFGTSLAQVLRPRSKPGQIWPESGQTPAQRWPDIGWAAAPRSPTCWGNASEKWGNTERQKGKPENATVGIQCPFFGRQLSDAFPR